MWNTHEIKYTYIYIQELIFEKNSEYLQITKKIWNIFCKKICYIKLKSIAEKLLRQLIVYHITKDIIYVWKVKAFWFKTTAFVSYQENSYTSSYCIYFLNFSLWDISRIIYFKYQYILLIFQIYIGIAPKLQKRF